MEQFFHKDRYRKIKDRIDSLQKLPEEKQVTFKKIKSIVEKYYNKDVDVYFFGSYKNGLWDELSDYDLMISDDLLDYNLKKIIEEELEIKVDIFFTSYFKNGILI